MGSGDATAVFHERFAIEPIGDDGVLIDLGTGSFFHLNPIATKACLALQESASQAEAAARLAAATTLSRDQATKLLEQVTLQMNVPGVRTETAGPFRYGRHEGGYALEEKGRTVLTMDQHGRALRMHVPPATLRFKPLDYVRAVTPKLLHLRGVTVLHASACLLPEGLTAFTGKSGAGKTTTVRAFADAGARLISEDLLVLAGAAPTLVVPDGERRAHAWAAAAAAALERAFDEPVDCDQLAAVSAGDATIPLREIWFIAPERRDGKAISRRPFGAIEGALALLANNFLGTEGPENWRRHVRETYALATQLALWEATMPSSLERLSAAARSYATKTAS